MERFIEWSGVTVVTISAMGLALLIEMGLLKLIFHCLAYVKVNPVEDCATVSVGKQWISAAPRIVTANREPSVLNRH